MHFNYASAFHIPDVFPHMFRHAGFSLKANILKDDMILVVKFSLRVFPHMYSPTCIPSHISPCWFQLKSKCFVGLHAFSIWLFFGYNFRIKIYFICSEKPHNFIKSPLSDLTDYNSRSNLKFK